jgi:hypothetical protein
MAVNAKPNVISVRTVKSTDEKYPVIIALVFSPWLSIMFFIQFLFGFSPRTSAVPSRFLRS